MNYYELFLIYNKNQAIETVYEEIIFSRLHHFLVVTLSLLRWCILFHLHAGSSKLKHKLLQAFYFSRLDVRCFETLAKIAVTLVLVNSWLVWCINTGDLWSPRVSQACMESICTLGLMWASLLLPFAHKMTKMTQSQFWYELIVN